MARSVSFSTQRLLIHQFHTYKKNQSIPLISQRIKCSYTQEINTADFFFLFYQKAVWVSASLASEDAEDETEEERQHGQPHHRQDPPFTNITLRVSSLGKQDQTEHDQTIDHHHEICLQDKLALTGSMNVGH